MRKRLQAVGVWIVWIGGFATGVQYLAAGGALVVAAVAFLLEETPLLFRAFLFLGLFIIASVVFNYLIEMFLVRRRGRSSDTPPPPDLNESAQLQAKLRAAEQEREELREENKELIDEFSTANGVTVPIPPWNLAVAYAPSSRPFVRHDELSDNYFKERSVCITDLARSGSIIADKTFEDCTIYGPAILFKGQSSGVDGRVIVDCSSDESDPEAVYWKATPGTREYFIGAISLMDSVLRRCHLVRIGVLLSENEYERVMSEDDVHQNETLGAIEQQPSTAFELGDHNAVTWDEVEVKGFDRAVSAGNGNELGFTRSNFMGRPVDAGEVGEKPFEDQREQGTDQETPKPEDTP